MMVRILAIIKTHSNNVYSRFLKCKMKIVAQLICERARQRHRKRDNVSLSVPALVCGSAGK